MIRPSNSFFLIGHKNKRHCLLQTNRLIKLRGISYYVMRNSMMSSSTKQVPDLKELIRRAELLKPLTKPWRLQIIDKDKFIDGNDIMELVNGIGTISKP